MFFTQNIIIWNNYIWIEYAIPQKDGIGTNSQIAVPGTNEENSSAKKLVQHKKIEDMTSGEREEYQYESDVRNISKILG